MTEMAIGARFQPFLWTAALLAAPCGAGEPDPALVTAEPAVREIALTGFTRARAELPLVAETPGRVEEVAHDIGGTIGEDGTFARLDDTFIALELEEVKVQQERLHAQIDYDQREVKRYTKLARKNNASASQLDTLEQTLRDNRHELRVLEVKERILEERLVRTRIRAPAGWRVTGRDLEPGQWVKDGESVGRAADFSALIVPFALTPEQHAALTASSGGISLRLPDLQLDVAATHLPHEPGIRPGHAKNRRGPGDPGPSRAPPRRPARPAEVAPAGADRGGDAARRRGAAQLRGALGHPRGRRASARHAARQQHGSRRRTAAGRLTGYQAGAALPAFAAES